MARAAWRHDGDMHGACVAARLFGRASLPGGGCARASCKLVPVHLTTTACVSLSPISLSSLPLTYHSRHRRGSGSGMNSWRGGEWPRTTRGGGQRSGLASSSSWSFRPRSGWLSGRMMLPAGWWVPAPACALSGMRTVANLCAPWAWIAAVDMVLSTWFAAHARSTTIACLLAYAPAFPTRTLLVLGQFCATLACTPHDGGIALRTVLWDTLFPDAPPPVAWGEPDLLCAPRTLGPRYIQWLSCFLRAASCLGRGGGW